MFRLCLCFVMLMGLGCAHTVNMPDIDGESQIMFIKFYQGPLNRFSAVRQGVCPMHPSCSEYASEALSVFGFPRGLIMMFDRLIRCGGDEVRLSPAIYVNGSLKCYDPVIYTKFNR